MKKGYIYTMELKSKKGINVCVKLKIDFECVYVHYNGIYILYSILINVY